jgi:hypothetical protein
MLTVRKRGRISTVLYLTAMLNRLINMMLTTLIKLSRGGSFSLSVRKSLQNVFG